MAKINLGVQKDILKRLEFLERSMKKKDDEITDLKQAIKTAEHSFASEINKRDIVISELYTEIDGLKSPNANSISTPDAETAVVADASEQSPIVEHDLLVIGDSLLRDLDTGLINPGGDTTIKCLPGARPEDVIDEFRRIAETDSFQRIIVHVGSNLIPKFSTSYVSAKVVECMETVKKLSPGSKIAFSQILPKEGDHLVSGISSINNQVRHSGICGPSRTRFGSVPHEQFFCDWWGNVNPRLFTGDGIHLNANGKLQLAKSMNKLM